MRIIGMELRLLEYPLATPFYPSWLPGYPLEWVWRSLTCGRRLPLRSVRTQQA